MYNRTKSLPLHSLACVMITMIIFACQTKKAQKYEANWASLSKHNAAPAWFRDAKFGIYFHWGVYSVPAFGSEWYPRNMFRKGSKEYDHHLKTYGHQTEFGYNDFVPMFKAENFDADEWAELFLQTGAKFAGPVAEHHDGFSMWDSGLTPWNAADKGPKRDITGELAAAIRKRGMRLITSFHHARNNLWEHENPDGKWNGHYSYVKTNFPSLLENPENAILYGFMPRAQFLDQWKNKLIEVVDKYQPDIMWFDSWLDEIPDSVKMAYIAHYLNKADELGKEAVITFKQEDLPQEVGVLDLEKGRMGDLTEFPWLTDDTISNGSWCYTDNLSIKPTSIVLHSLIDIVSKNGVLLLNISPMADGTIPEDQKTVLKEIGAWLSKYGEAIYHTRPWLTFGEGPTKLRAGHFGGFTDAEGYTAQDIRYTKNGKVIYAIVLGWPGEIEKITMTAFGKDGHGNATNIVSISIPGVDDAIKWEKTDGGLIVTTPQKRVDDLAVVFKLETD